MSTFETPYDGFCYMPHQSEAIEWMTTRELEEADCFRGGILADEMGLGKTWMTIGLLLNSIVPNTLLLVPPALQPQWAEVMRRSGISHRILGPPTKTQPATWKSFEGHRDMSVTMSTYDRAHMKVDVLLADTEYDRIVCDEGHVLRNGPHIKRFTQLMKIPASRKWILSGTPIQNSSNDLNNLLTFLGMEPERRLKDLLVEIASKVIMRRTVGDVRGSVPTMPLAKPVHIVHAVTFPPGSEEESVFNALARRLEHAMEVHASTMIVLELYLRIRQFLAHPNIYVQSLRRKYSKEEYKREAWTGTATKAAEFERFMRDAPKEATIVFATFKAEMDLAELTMRQAGYTVYSIRGGISDAQREAATQESKADVEAGKAVAIVVQIVAGGAGLNLQHCSRIFFLSSHWNPAIVDQAIARAYRMGQTKTVEVHHLMIADSAEKNIDRLMASLHGQKRSIATGIHSKLFCDSAVANDFVMGELDAVVGLFTEEDPK